jgi:hypothetical protein
LTGEKPPEQPAVGPLAQEAAMLLDVVADRLSSMKPAEGAGEEAAEPSGRCPECGSVPGASCTACPLCRFVAVLRGERPEATARLVDGALLIVRTLRSLIPEADGGAADGAPRPDPGPPPARRSGLEHIDIS